MRISADRPDYPSRPAYCLAVVTLDGKLQRDCRSADDERGEVVVLKRDAAGELVRGKDAYVTETRRGCVAISWPLRLTVLP